MFLKKTSTKCFDIVRCYRWCLVPLPPPPTGVTNASFICGKAEDVMGDIVLPMASRGDIIGIVDPPRGGLRE